LNLLCLWLAAQLFFNEKTTAFSFQGIANVRPDRILLVGLVMYVLLSRRTGRLESRKLIREEILMAGLFFLLFASCLIAGVTPLNYHLSTVVTFIGAPGFTFWLCRRVSVTAVNIRRLLLTMVAIGAYLGLCGACEHFGWRLPIFPDFIFDPSVGIHFGRSRGPFVNAPAFGGALCIIATMSLWFARHPQPSAARSVRATVVTTVLVGLMVASVYFSDTRAAWVDLGLVIVVLAGFPNGMRRYAVGAVLLAVVLFVSGVSSKFSLYEPTLFGRRDEAAYSRVVLADATMVMIQQRPLPTTPTILCSTASSGDSFVARVITTRSWASWSKLALLERSYTWQSLVDLCGDPCASRG
jgi:hypothetical protein